MFLSFWVIFVSKFGNEKELERGENSVSVCSSIWVSEGVSNSPESYIFPGSRRLFCSRRIQRTAFSNLWLTTRFRDQAPKKDEDGAVFIITGEKTWVKVLREEVGWYFHLRDYSYIRPPTRKWMHASKQALLLAQQVQNTRERRNHLSPLSLLLLSSQIRPLARKVITPRETNTCRGEIHKHREKSELRRGCDGIQSSSLLGRKNPGKMSSCNVTWITIVLLIRKGDKSYFHQPLRRRREDDIIILHADFLTTCSQEV